MAWADDLPPRYMVVTRCGKEITWFATSMDPPEGRELCDACALADFLQWYVYRFFNADNELLYVGFTNNPIERFKQHSRQSSSSQRWWPLQRRYTLTLFGSSVEAFEAEQIAIASEKPLYNRNGVPRGEWLEVAA